MPPKRSRRNSRDRKAVPSVPRKRRSGPNLDFNLQLRLVNLKFAPQFQARQPENKLQVRIGTCDRDQRQSHVFKCERVPIAPSNLKACCASRRSYRRRKATAMSSNTSGLMADGGYFNGNTMHHPRPRKTAGSHLRSEVLAGPGLVGSERTPGGTPAPPDDAPPSVKATSAARRELRKKTRARLFPTVDYQERLSYFDPNQNTFTNFRGFFVLFWVGLAIMVVTSMLRNLKETGQLLSFRQYPTFVKNIWELVPADLLMCASTAIDIPLHFLYSRSSVWLRWNKGGIIVQSLVQALWLWFWVQLPFMRDWTWTSQVFFTLHVLALFMKMHSYAFYCGHLSTTLNRLKELDMPLGPQTPTTAAVRYPRTPLAGPMKDEDSDEGNEHASLPPIMQLRDDLAKEITSPQGNMTYPDNLTVANFADYLLCPTLCYELEYPRNETRSYLELFYKTLAVFGCIFLMTVASEEFILPVLDESHDRLQATQSNTEKALIFAETVSTMLFPFMVIFLLVFLVIFEYVLGAFAEITRFADRQFYSDWWNCLDWLEFSKTWNLPVHNFFRRHVYSASRGVKMSRPAATAITFLVSGLAHELVMGCITRKFRGYGFVLLMLQMPLVMIQRMPFIRERKLMNNIMFWICMIMGLSLVRYIRYEFTERLTLT